LPLKANLGEKIPVPGRLSRKKRRQQQKWVDNADNELIFYLKVEALNQARTPSLMQVLTGKAKRFLEKFDTADLSWERRYSIIIAAVKVAMMIDEQEDSLRQALKNADQDELRAKQASMLKSGTVGHSGPRFFGLGRDSTLPK
jgi:hypothetical protein